MKGTCEQIPFHFFLKFMMLTYATGADLSAGLSSTDQKAKNYADNALQSADKSAKGYADAAQSAAVKAANANTEELLKSYPTVTAMESAIKQNADSITASVSKTYACLLYTSPSPRDTR